MAIAPIKQSFGPTSVVGEQRPRVLELPNMTQEQATQLYLFPGQTYGARASLLDNASTANKLGIPDLSQGYLNLINELGGRDKANSGLYGIYSDFGKYLGGLTGQKDSFYGSLNKDMLGRLSELMTQYQDTYGPQGQITNRVNRLYGDYGNYVLNKNAQDRAIASGMANKYGLSDNARRIGESEIGLQGLNDALKIFDEETKQLDNINKTFNALTTDGFGKYKGIQDDYLKSAFDQNFGLNTQLSQSLLQMLAANEQLKAQKLIAGTGAGVGSGVRTGTGTVTQQQSQTPSFEVVSFSADPKVQTPATVKVKGPNGVKDITYRQYIEAKNNGLIK